MQLGPTIRMPCCLTNSVRRCSRAAPSAPISRNPEEMTTTPFTPCAAHWPTTSSTRSLGTTMIAWSTTSGTSPMAGYALIAQIDVAFGLTG